MANLWKKFWKGVGETALNIVTFGGYSAMKDAQSQKAAAERQAKIDYQNSLYNKLLSLEDEIELDIFSSISDAQALLADAQLQLGTIDNNITAAQDWLALYQGMLNGEDNLLSAERDVAKNAITSSQNALEQYELSSALAVRNIFDEANNQVQSAKQSIAMANVAASATGSAAGAYKTEALKVKSDLRRYVGADGYLNEATGEGEIGTFAQDLIVTRTEINNTPFDLDADVKAAQLALETWDYETKKQAEGYENDIEGYEALRESYQLQLEAAKKNIKTYSQAALERIKEWKETMSEYAETGADDALSISEIEDQILNWEKKYKNIGVSVKGARMTGLAKALIVDTDRAVRRMIEQAAENK